MLGCTGQRGREPLRTRRLDAPSEAPFRDTRLCSRCGADLAPLMRLAAHAWHLRESARSALTGGAVGPALDLVSQAERLQSTPQGARLLTLARWLAAVVE